MVSRRTVPDIRWIGSREEGWAVIPNGHLLGASGTAFHESGEMSADPMWLGGECDVSIRPQDGSSPEDRKFKSVEIRIRLCAEASDNNTNFLLNFQQR